MSIAFLTYQKQLFWHRYTDVMEVTVLIAEFYNIPKHLLSTVWQTMWLLFFFTQQKKKEKEVRGRKW